jgi:zinc transport system substrate-binding protein
MRLIIFKWYSMVVWMLAGFIPAHTLASPTVVASIKPVSMLVSAVVGDHLEVKTLLAANVSPHEYALRFSDIRLLKQAGFIVWVGPELEGVLVKALDTIPLERQLSLAQVEGMVWPDTHEGSDDHGHEHHDDQDEHQLYQDPHLWLNPRNAVQAVEAIAVELSRQYPEHKVLFTENAAQFSLRLMALDHSTARALATEKDRGFVVVHDGYRHFVDYYGLKQLSAIQLTSGNSRGAKHYGDIIAHGEQVACVFTEPQLNNKGAIQLAEKLGAKRGTLDLMGGDIALGKDS